MVAAVEEERGDREREHRERREREQQQQSQNGFGPFDSESSSDALQLVGAARQQVAELRGHTADVVRLLSGAAAGAPPPVDGNAAALSSALALEPSDAAAASLRGYVRRKQGRFREAAEDYSRALAGISRKDPNSSSSSSSTTPYSVSSNAAPASASATARLHVSLAYCLAKAGDPSGAVSHYDAAIELEEGEEERKDATRRAADRKESSGGGSSSPNASLSHARHNRGVLLARRGEHAAAVEDFNAALAALGPSAFSSANSSSASASPNDGGAVAALLFSRGSSLDALGRFDEAVTDYMRALSVGGNGNKNGGKQQQQVSAAAKPLRR